MDVLRHHGIQTTVQKIWPRVTRRDPFGTRCARSYLLAAEARRCGLQAAVLQCRDARAWQALQFCHAHRLTVIVNHRAPAAMHEGHFSVLTAITEQTICVRDPITAAVQRFHRPRWLELWQPNCETPGQILIAIAPPAPLRHASVRCPRCAATLQLAPSALFAVSDWQHDGLWRRCFCLACDASFHRSFPVVPYGLRRPIQ